MKKVKDSDNLTQHTGLVTVFIVSRLAYDKHGKWSLMSDLDRWFGLDVRVRIMKAINSSGIVLINDNQRFGTIIILGLLEPNKTTNTSSAVNKSNEDVNYPTFESYRGLIASKLEELNSTYFKNTEKIDSKPYCNNENVSNYQPFLNVLLHGIEADDQEDQCIKESLTGYFTNLAKGLSWHICLYIDEHSGSTEATESDDVTSPRKAPLQPVPGSNAHCMQYERQKSPLIDEDDVWSQLQAI